MTCGILASDVRRDGENQGLPNVHGYVFAIGGINLV
jgi:hypothetical protein